MIHTNRVMRVQSGIVVGVPISTKDAMNAGHIEEAIQVAIIEANEKKLSGKGTVGLCCTVLHCVVVLCSCTVLNCGALHCTALYCAVLQCTVLYCGVLRCTVCCN
jgi:Indigoidine synthase A like protein